MQVSEYRTDIAIIQHLMIQVLIYTYTCARRECHPSENTINVVRTFEIKLLVLSG